MKLFISYARVDKPYCEQIVKTLDIHEVWYDRRLHAGQAWWDEILRRLDWCDGFVYLLSPESVNSEYCQKEFAVAQAASKHLFPVLIQARTPIPDALSHVHYADVSDGLNADAVKVLLDAIYFAERQIWQQKPVQQLPAQKIQAPQAETGPDLGAMLADIEALMDAGNFDQAAFLLKDLREKPNLPRVILNAIPPLLHEAEQQLEWQAYIKEAERDYRPLVALVKGKRTQAAGCEGLQEFLARFPDYDPDNLAEIYEQAAIAKTPPPAPAIIKPTPKIIDVRKTLPTPFEWCEIPAGKVTLETGHTFEVTAFQMAKYPITNAQYEVFLKAKDGYAEARWWDYSEGAQQWRAANMTPKNTAFGGDVLPRTSVTWYDSVAFCRWLSSRTGQKIMLPSEQAWQRAAQGDDGRTYPWGNQKPDKELCNFGCNVWQTTSVTQYPTGASPYGVMDMAGNVWEWCLTEWDWDTAALNINGNNRRVLRGGSWDLSDDDVRSSSRDWNSPDDWSYNIGFRCVRSD